MECACGCKPEPEDPDVDRKQDAIPQGSVLTDRVNGHNWKVGPLIQYQGTGFVCFTEPDSDLPVTDDANYVLKYEICGSGGLALETLFYGQASQQDTVTKWITTHQLKYLPVAKHICFGYHKHNGNSYRFLVMPRYGPDLEKFFVANGNKFTDTDAFLLALRLTDALQYIHTLGWVHVDIKTSNIVCDRVDTDLVYLIDYDLCCTWRLEAKTLLYDGNYGTREFTSRDAHIGDYPSRRGDLEILAYCLIEWLCGDLPWRRCNWNVVYEKKQHYMTNLGCLLTDFHLHNKPYSGSLMNYLSYVAHLEYTEDPDYERCREIFKEALQTLGCDENSRLTLHIETA